MNMNFNLYLTQEQKLIMTQQMQLSVKILQLSSYELQKYIEKELQENPVLELKYKDVKPKSNLDYKELIKYFEYDKYSNGNFVKKDEEEISPFTFISEKKSLKEFLKEQVRELNEKDSIKTICKYIIENIDGRGYLDETLENISKDLKISMDLAEKTLRIVQSLEPDGIGARDLKECLRIQLKNKNVEDVNLYNIIDNYLELIAENKYNIMAKELNIDVRKAQEYGDYIKNLQPKPSRGFYTGEETKYIVPDAYIKKIDKEYYILMNEEVTPRLSINRLYKEIINRENDKEAVSYVKNKLNNAVFLIKSIDHRKSTIYMVLEKIIEKQKEYFDKGKEYIKPMTLKEIAEQLDMHESTISRAIRDKYIYTSRGTVKIKDLFTTGISTYGISEELSTVKIKNLIKELVDKENKSKPLSDQAICNMLNEDGVNISRRTVAKYREEIGIKSSKGRKRF